MKCRSKQNPLIVGVVLLFAAATQAAVIVNFDTTDIGVTKKNTVWSIGITEGPNSIAKLMGEIDHIRFAAVQEYALEADGSLSAEAKAEVDGYVVKMDQVPYPITATIMSSSTASKVHPSYVKPNGTDIDPDKWAAMWRAYIDYVENHHGRTVSMLEPMNEIDWGDKYGNKANWAEIFALFKADPVLSRYPLAGPSTLNAGSADSWYGSIKDNVDWGGTHVISGSMNALIKFMNRVTEDGKAYFANENHNLAEMILCANYGGIGGLWWDIDTVKGEWTHIHQNARQIAYVEDRNDWTVATAYKQPNKIWLFVSGGTRASANSDQTIYTFTSTDRPVYFDGVGPTNQFSITVVKDTRESIEVTWDGGDSVAPGAPAGLTAVSDAESVILDWNDNAEADLAGYIVYRADKPGGPYTEIATRLTASHYADGGRIPGEPNYYVVVAVDDSGNDSAYSTEVVGTALAGIVQANDDFESVGFAGGAGWSGSWALSGPTAPTIATRNGNDAAQLVNGGQMVRNLASAANGGVLKFLWDVDNLDSGEQAIAEVYDGSWHEVWSADYQKNGSDTENSADNTLNSLAWQSVGLGIYGPITQIRFRNTGDGAWDFFFLDSVTLTVRGGDSNPPTTPPGLLAVAQTNGIVSLDWTDNSEPDLAGYHVWRSATSGGPYVRIATAIPGSAYNDSGATSGVTSYYKVSAVDASLNESGKSPFASAVANDLQAPAAPTGLFSVAGRGKVELGWSDSPEPRFGGYRVYRKTVSGAFSLIASNILHSSYRDENATPNSAYLYAVTVRDEAGNESVKSSEVYASPLALQVSDNFETSNFAGGTGWSGSWVLSGSSTPTVVADSNGNDAAKMVGGGMLTRTLATAAEGGVLDFRWDIDNLDAGENAIVEVFDGAWHQVWSGGNSQNGVESVNSANNQADALQWASISLESFGPITQIRFSNTGTGAWDVFFVDDVRFYTRQTLVPPMGGTVNVGLGASATTDSTNGSNVPVNAVDGNTTSNSSRWVSANTAWPHWIELNLGAQYQISQVKFWTGFDGYNKPPSDFQFQYWSNGQWLALFSETGNTDPTYSRVFSPVNTSKVRLYATAGPDNFFRLYEIQVYGVPASVPVTLSIAVDGSGAHIGLNSNPNTVYQLQRYDSAIHQWVNDGSSINTSGQIGVLPRTFDRALITTGALYRVSAAPAGGG